MPYTMVKAVMIVQELVWWWKATLWSTISRHRSHANLNVILSVASTLRSLDSFVFFNAPPLSCGYRRV